MTGDFAEMRTSCPPLQQAARRVALTGANGFLGLHVRAALQEQGIESVPIAVGDSFDKQTALQAIDGAEALLHVAGVNRGTEDEVSDGNRLFATQLSEVLRLVKEPPERVVYANSIQAGNGTVYGTAKRDSAAILRSTAAVVGSQFEDVALPNLFGEFGKPRYNSVVATFSHLVARGEEVTIEQDKELTLLHVADAADVLIGAVPTSGMEALTHCETVSGVATLLKEFARLYSKTEIPALTTDFHRNLFNTYRSYLYPQSREVP